MPSYGTCSTCCRARRDCRLAFDHPAGRPAEQCTVLGRKSHDFGPRRFCSFRRLQSAVR